MLLDIAVYGFIMGIETLAVWATALYANDSYPLKSGCNSAANADSCEIVFRARGASYAALSILILVHAVNCRSIDKSGFFSEHYNMRNLICNKVLFGSILFGLCFTVVSLYIPGLNTEAFLQAPISWEWGMIVAAVILFVAFSEAYKFVKLSFMHKAFTGRNDAV